MDPTVNVPITSESLTERAVAVLDAMQGGALAPSQATQLLQALQALAKVAEMDELARRISESARPRIVAGNLNRH